jgi:FMN-dependent NADH-azoreductase
VLNFVGITDISIIRADGLAPGPEPRQRAITAALDQIADVFQRAA